MQMILNEKGMICAIENPIRLIKWAHPISALKYSQNTIFLRFNLHTNASSLYHIQTICQ